MQNIKNTGQFTPIQGPPKRPEFLNINHNKLSPNYNLGVQSPEDRPTEHMPTKYDMGSVMPLTPNFEFKKKKYF